MSKETALQDEQRGEGRGERVSVDHSGRNRLAQNVLASWGGHLVFVIMGFILPRLLDQKLGVTALGIWDFGWSIVSYFEMAQVGVGSSVSYYVATSRTVDDKTALNTAVSSAMSLQLVASVVVVSLTLGTVYVLPLLFQARLGEFLVQAEWVVLFLGLSVAVQVAFDSFRGVMTGSHHWALHNAINASAYAVNACGMLSVLALGGGLAELAGAYFSVIVLTELVRAGAAYRVTPELRIRWRYVDRSQIRDMLAYGGKTILVVLSYLLLYQTTNLFITAYLGAGALALYARPMALIRHCSTFVEKFAFVLSPTASSIYASKQQSELQHFFLQSIQYSVYLSLPPLVFLAILGAPLLHLWMGAQYSHSELVAVLACGHLMAVGHAPMWSILRGMNKHGPFAVARIVGSLFAVVLTFVALGVLQKGLIGAAVAVSLVLIVFDGIVIPWYACRQLELSLVRCLTYTWGRPLLCVLPFAWCLVIIHLFFFETPLMAVLYGTGVGGLVLALTYWHLALPQTMREQIKEAMRNFLRVPRLAAQPSSNNDQGG